MKLIGKLLINILALLVVGYLVPGFILVDWRATIAAAIVIGIMNTLLKTILQVVALPISIMTFGIAAFLINVSLLWLTSHLVPGFEIASFTTAMIASVVLSLVSWFLNRLASE